MSLGTAYVDEESPRVGAEPVFGYRLLHRLGSGGHGEVWKAEAPGGFHVAMKFIRLGDGLGPNEMRGLEILRKLRHPNLLVTFGAWQVPGYLVLGMELADRTLWDRFCECVDQGKPGIPRDELIEYLAETAKGVDYLNESRPALEGEGRAGVQHRDLKPQNILLAGGGVKVGDFGLARQLDHSMASHTGHWTFAYAAPEFFRRQTACQSDQYSLAATYCHLRGGRPPFNGPAAVIMAGHLLLPPDLSMLPEEERPIVARALAKAPKERWPNCRSFVEALRLARPAAPLISLDAGVTPEFAESPGAEAPPPAAPEGSTPAVLTEIATKTYSDELPVLSDFPADLLGPSSSDDLPAVAEPPAEKFAGNFPAENLLAYLNEPERRGPSRRLLAVGMSAALLLATGVVLWAAGFLPFRGGAGAAVAEHFGPPPSTSPVHVGRALASGNEPATGATGGSQVGRPAVAIAARRAPVVSTPSAEEKAEAPPLLPPAEEAPLGITAPDRISVRPGGEGRIEIQVRRHGKEGPVALALEGAPAGVALEPATIPEGKDSAGLTVKAGAGIGAGTYAGRLVARVGEAQAEAEVRLVVEAASRGPRLDLKLPPAVAMRAGRGVRLPIRVAREGVEGPLWVHFEGLPEGVAAADVPVPAGSDRVEAHLSAVVEAPRAERQARVVVSGGSSRAEAPLTIAVDPSPALVLVRQGRSLLDREKYDEALAALDQALRLSPEEAAAYTLRGSILTKKGEYQRAIADFGEALRRNADDAAAYNNRGLARRGLGEYHRAIADYNEAIRLNPGDAIVRYNRGMAYHHLGDDLMAIADFAKAIELDPNHSPSYRARGDAYARLGDQARAKEDREKARLLDAGGHGRPGRIQTIPGPGRSSKPTAPKRVVSHRPSPITSGAARPA